MTAVTAILLGLWLVGSLVAASVVIAACIVSARCEPSGLLIDNPRREALRFRELSLADERRLHRLLRPTVVGVDDAAECAPAAGYRLLG